MRMEVAFPPRGRRGSGPGATRHGQDENSKHQAPNTKEIPSSKSQFCPRRRRLGACDLRLFWCLELGVWCFDIGVWDWVFRLAGPAEYAMVSKVVLSFAASAGHCRGIDSPR